MCINSNRKGINFYKFANLNLLGSKIFNGKTSIEDALQEQVEIEKLLMSLEKYDPSNTYKIKTGKEVLKNAEDLFETRNRIVNAFRDGIFPLAKDVQKTDQSSKSWLDP